MSRSATPEEIAAGRAKAQADMQARGISYGPRTFTQSFIIEGKYYGKAQRSVGRSSIQLLLGYSFFCPECGRLWASCPVADDSTRRTLGFMVWTRSCGSCRDDIGVPAGSVFLSWDREWNAVLPLEALRREFGLHIAWAERRGLLVSKPESLVESQPTGVPA